jgi:AcrR family transcriptional regulator
MATAPSIAPAGEPVRRNPRRTREQILQAAVAEFAAKGLGGTRINEIAARAGANKRMIYHYFGNKEALFLAVLEHTYASIREGEAELSLTDLAPEAAMRELIRFSFDYFLTHPEFVTLLNSENLHRARHLRRSRRIREMHSPLLRMLGEVLERGEAEGIFRPGVDPVQLYISIAALGYFYFSNIHTLSTIFDRDLAAPAGLEHRKSHVTEVIIGYLRPAADGASTHA